MKKFMLIINDPEEGIYTSFADSWDEAEHRKQVAECCLGCYVECYERVEKEYGGNYERLY